MERSCNPELAEKQKEYNEEVETKMKLTGFKLKDRVRRVIIKLLEKEVDLDNIIRMHG